MAGRMSTLPSRRTGTPNQGKVVLATFEASSCRGNVIWLKTMAGMGIINTRKGQGNRRGPKEIPAEEEDDEARQHNQQGKAGKEKLGTHLTQDQYAQSESQKWQAPP